MAQDENSNQPYPHIRPETLTALYDRVEALESSRAALRDQFAMAALSEVLHQSKMTDTDLHLAQTAYRLADAMIAARLIK